MPYVLLPEAEWVEVDRAALARLEAQLPGKMEVLDFAVMTEMQYFAGRREDIMEKNSWHSMSTRTVPAWDDAKLAGVVKLSDASGSDPPEPAYVPEDLDADVGDGAPLKLMFFRPMQYLRNVVLAAQSAEGQISALFEIKGAGLPRWAIKMRKKAFGDWLQLTGDLTANVGRDTTDHIVLEGWRVWESPSHGSGVASLNDALAEYKWEKWFASLLASKVFNDLFQRFGKQLFNYLFESSDRSLKKSAREFIVKHMIEDASKDLPKTFKARKIYKATLGTMEDHVETFTEWFRNESIRLFDLWGGLPVPPEMQTLTIYGVAHSKLRIKHPQERGEIGLIFRRSLKRQQDVSIGSRHSNADIFTEPLNHFAIAFAAALTAAGGLYPAAKNGKYLNLQADESRTVLHDFGNPGWQMFSQSGEALPNSPSEDTFASSEEEAMARLVALREADQAYWGGELLVRQGNYPVGHNMFQHFIDDVFLK
eukprot:TRINITY_DN23662_c0_g1_i1.p1 TRINITY_DN23662_c0_g1~~TRINITY_DN23662_c0_g1_i1.p1  ORF type:complete len:480 (-),score=103.89 TRINITY_DN23662_c0_g1_i1:111-1550(-)